MPNEHLSPARHAGEATATAAVTEAATGAATRAATGAPGSAASPVGLLLAGGLGSRFDPDGRSNKLLAPLARGPHAGQPVAWVAACTLKAALPRVIAVLRPDGVDTRALAALLRRAGCEVVASAAAARGMGASLAAGVAASADAPGWVVALADMPWLRAATVAAVAAAVDHEAALVAPRFRGSRGHPVGFGRAHRAALLQLDGDVGARALLARDTLCWIDTDDPGVLDDVDTPAAL